MSNVSMIDGHIDREEINFTDREIIKALECLHKRVLQSKFAEEVTETEIMGLVGALDLINRQQAEIDNYSHNIKKLTEDHRKLQIRLRKERHQFEDLGKMYSEIRAEAIKEFAKKLKEKAPIIEGLYFKTITPISCNTIDNLVKEMVGEQE